MLIKVIGLLKRRQGLTPEQFRDYYESRHRLIGEKFLRGHACKYLRRYLEPQDSSHRPALDAEAARPFDVILEIWYPDDAAYVAARNVLSLPEVIKEIVADEEQLFDRSANRFFTVNEVESTLS